MVKAADSLRPFTQGMNGTLSTPWAHARRKSGQLALTGKTTAISTFYRPHDRTTTAGHHKGVRWSQSIGQGSTVLLEMKGENTTTSRDQFLNNTEASVGFR